MVNSFEHIDARLSSMERILTEIKTRSKSSFEDENDDVPIEDAEKILILGRKRIYAIQKRFTVKKQGKRLVFSRKELQAYVNRSVKTY